MKTAYHQGYVPPFPQLTTIVEFDQTRLDSRPALVDSGADATLIPVALLEEVGAWKSGNASIRSHFGESQKVDLYLVSLHVDGRVLPGIYVVGDPSGSEVVLGRDVLNKITLFLDGPEEQTYLLDEATVKRLRGAQA